jgi:CRP-like cAMP-binding protein
MRLDQLAIPLLRHEIFHGLKPLQITEIARRAERAIYLPGQVMMQAGEMGDGAILVVGGEARMSGEGVWGLDEATVPAGALLGEMCMLIEQEHGATVMAETMVRGLKILRSTMHELMLDDPGLAQHFSHRISRRLARVADELRRIDDTMAETYHLPL